MSNFFNDLMSGLKEAVAFTRGEIDLPCTTYEHTHPFCPLYCRNLRSDGDCLEKEDCFVRVDENGNRTKDPTKYRRLV